MAEDLVHRIWSKVSLALKQAQDIALLSPDEWKKVGCMGLDINYDASHLGYNHYGWRCGHKPHNFTREGRRPFIIHAELDMLSKVESDKVFAVVNTLLPCSHCMTAIASRSIREVYFEEAYEKDLQAIEVAKFHNIAIFQIQNDGDKFNIIRAEGGVGAGLRVSKS